MRSVSIGAAFLAGLASFLSPCVLPLVPGYISFMSGLSLEELSSGEARPGVTRRAAWAGLAVLGISLVLLAASSVHVYFGSVTSATADGRSAWQPLSEGVSPVQGADRHGPTAVIRSGWPTAWW